MQIAHSQLRLQPRITLVFAEVGPGPTIQIGPFPEIWVDGETLRAERGGEVLAEHKSHSWSVQGREFFRGWSSPPPLHPRAKSVR